MPHECTRSQQGGFTPSETTLAKARAFHDRHVTIDGHVHVPTAWAHHEADLVRDTGATFDLHKAQRGRVAAAVLNIFAFQGPDVPDAVLAAQHEARLRYQGIRRLVAENPSDVVLAAHPQAVQDAFAAGKFSVILGFQNAFVLDSSFEELDNWIAAGIRQFCFTHHGHNRWADSSRPYANHGDLRRAAGGLSALGAAAIARLNAAGILIDVSQLSTAALYQVLERSSAPVIASHSALRSSVDVARNLGADEVRAIAGAGGVVNIVAFAPYLKPYGPAVIERVSALWRRHGAGTPADLSEIYAPAVPAMEAWAPEKWNDFKTALYEALWEAPRVALADYLDVIEHAVQLAGIEHVGIASDFNQGGGIAGWQNAAQTVNLTAALLQRGYAEDNIAKLWGRNYLRVWGEAQALAVQSNPTVEGNTPC